MKRTTTLILSLIIAASAISQNLTMELKDSSNLKKCKMDNQYDYENYLSPYPPKKKNNWAIGLGVGSPLILGDVRPLMMESFGADLKIRKAFSHVFSLRFQSVFAEMKGIDSKTKDPAPDNHKTRMTDNTLQAVFTLNNINFHKKQSKVGFNVFVGGGVATNFTQFNLLDENGNPYDYSGLSNVETPSDRRFSVNEIRNILDDGYETSINPEDGKAKIKNTTILPSLVFGGGMDIYLSKRVDLALESRLSRHFTDNLDGYQQGKGNDWFLYSSVGVNFKIGKRTQPLYWENPLNESYYKIMDLKQNSDPATSFQDMDQDGVADILDRDLNTPFGAAVTTTGEALDSDKDGIPDYRDEEVFSPKDAKVYSNGVAIDTDGDGIADVLDQDNSTPDGALVDANGREIKNLGGSGPAPSVNNILYMRGVDVWSIFFDSDDYNVKQEYHAIILNLASYMIEDPSASLILTGYTDSRSSAEYNLELSKKRANSVLAYFTKLGIDPGRFEVQFKGEQELLIEENNSLGQQLNRRVTLKVK